MNCTIIPLPSQCHSLTKIYLSYPMHIQWNLSITNTSVKRTPALLMLLYATFFSNVMVEPWPQSSLWYRTFQYNEHPLAPKWSLHTVPIYYRYRGPHRCNSSGSLSHLRVLSECTSGLCRGTIWHVVLDQSEKGIVETHKAHVWLSDYPWQEKFYSWKLN